MHCGYPIPILQKCVISRANAHAITHFSSSFPPDCFFLQCMGTRAVNALPGRAGLEEQLTLWSLYKMYDSPPDGVGMNWLMISRATHIVLIGRRYCVNSVRHEDTKRRNSLLYMYAVTALCLCGAVLARTDRVKSSPQRTLPIVPRGPQIVARVWHASRSSHHIHEASIN